MLEDACCRAKECNCYLMKRGSDPARKHALFLFVLVWPSDLPDHERSLCFCHSLSRDGPRCELAPVHPRQSQCANPQTVSASAIGVAEGVDRIVSRGVHQRTSHGNIWGLLVGEGPRVAGGERRAERRSGGGGDMQCISAMDCAW